VPARPRHARHFADGARGRVEVVDGALADHRVEALVRERQRVRPGAQRRRRFQRAAMLAPELGGQRGHAGRGLGRHRQRAALGQPTRVLTQPAGDVQNAPARGGPRQRQGALRHAREQVLGVAAHGGGNDVPHVPIEIDDAHGTAP